MLQSKRFVHKIVLGESSDLGEKRKLGFTIVGGTDSVKGAMGIYVKNISEDGLAYGRLCKGDEIISIKGTNLQNMSHHEALATIKTCKSHRPIDFLIGRRRYMRQTSLPSSTFDSFSTIPEELSTNEQSDDNGADDDASKINNNWKSKILKSEGYDDAKQKSEDTATTISDEFLKINSCNLENEENLDSPAEHHHVARLLDENNLKIENQPTNENILKTVNEMNPFQDRTEISKENSLQDRTEISNESEHDTMDEGIGLSECQSKLETIESYNTSNSDVFEDSFDSSFDKKPVCNFEENDSKITLDRNVLSSPENDNVFTSEINNYQYFNRSQSQINDTSCKESHFTRLKMGRDNHTMHKRPPIERNLQDHHHNDDIDDDDDDDDDIDPVKSLHLSENFTLLPTIKRRQVHSISHLHDNRVDLKHRLNKIKNHDLNVGSFTNLKSNSKYSLARNYETNNNNNDDENFQRETDIKKRHRYHGNANDAYNTTTKFHGLMTSNTKPILFESNKLSTRDQLINKYKRKHELNFGIMNPIHARLSKSSTSLHKQSNWSLW